MEQRNSNLAPQHSGDDDSQDWAIEPMGAPEEYGLSTNSTLQKRNVWERQELFLQKYREVGKPGRAAKAVWLSRFTAIHWDRHDIFGFKERLKVAHADYCETIEQLIDDRLENPTGNRGSDVLAMFRAKGEMPEKYRDNYAPTVTPQGIKVTSITYNLAPGVEPPAPQPVTDGEYRELPAGEDKEPNGET